MSKPLSIRRRRFPTSNGSFILRYEDHPSLRAPCLVDSRSSHYRSAARDLLATREYAVEVSGTEQCLAETQVSNLLDDREVNAELEEEKEKHDADPV